MCTYRTTRPCVDIHNYQKREDDDNMRRVFIDVWIQHVLLLSYNLYILTNIVHTNQFKMCFKIQLPSLEKVREKKNQSSLITQLLKIEGDPCIMN